MPTLEYVPFLWLRRSVSAFEATVKKNESRDISRSRCLEASNDRVGGWQLMYELLQKGEWLIADPCPQLIESIASRLHDRKRPGDLRKLPGDPLDDVADSARYGIYSFINASSPPQDLIDYEQLRHLASIGT